jgi:hypothetical protein
VAHGIRGTLKQGEWENSFGQHSSLFSCFTWGHLAM